MNQAVHKYNQCLGYCRQNGEDLAIIQLKKVVVAHPSFLKAYQLLALLYMHSGQYSKARQSLKTALKLDVTNDITLRYMHELNRQRNRQVAHIKEEKHGRQSVVTYNLGNETIIQPAATLRDNAAVMTVVNILIGMVVGAAVVWFLIAPAVNQTKSSTKNRNVIALSEQIASQKTQIQTLKDELEGYRNSSDEVESAKQTAASTQDSYDALIKVYQQYYGGTTSNADMADTLLGLNRDSLGEEGQKIYDSISGSVFPRVCVSCIRPRSMKCRVEIMMMPFRILKRSRRWMTLIVMVVCTSFLETRMPVKVIRTMQRAITKKQRPIIREHRQHIRHRAHWMQWDQMELRRILPVEQAPRDNKI